MLVLLLESINDTQSFTKQHRGLHAIDHCLREWLCHNGRIIFSSCGNMAMYHQPWRLYLADERSLSPVEFASSGCFARMESCHGNCLACVGFIFRVLACLHIAYCVSCVEVSARLHYDVFSPVVIESQQQLLMRRCGWH